MKKPRKQAELAQVLSIRFPEALIEKLDRYVLQFQQEFPGISFHRTDAVRLFVERGLQSPTPGTQRTPEEQPPKVRVPQFRMLLSDQASKKRILAVIAMVTDSRLEKFRKKLTADLEKTDFRSIFLDTYVRLGCWAHAAASFAPIAGTMCQLSRELFGYEIPPEISGILLKDYKDSPLEVLAAISPPLIDYHQAHLR